MLKQPLFPPTRPQRARTRLSPYFCFASFRRSTGTRPPHHSAARTDLVLLIRRTVRPRDYAFGFDSPPALLDELFEHPADVFPHRLRLGNHSISEPALVAPLADLGPG